MFSNPDIIPSMATQRARELAEEADRNRRSGATMTGDPGQRRRRRRPAKIC